MSPAEVNVYKRGINQIARAFGSLCLDMLLALQQPARAGAKAWMDEQGKPTGGVVLVLCVVHLSQSRPRNGKVKGRSPSTYLLSCSVVRSAEVSIHLDGGGTVGRKTESHQAQRGAFSSLPTSLPFLPLPKRQRPRVASLSFCCLPSNCHPSFQDCLPRAFQLTINPTGTHVKAQAASTSLVPLPLLLLLRRCKLLVRFALPTEPLPGAGPSENSSAY